MKRKNPSHFCRIMWFRSIICIAVAVVNIGLGAEAFQTKPANAIYNPIKTRQILNRHSISQIGYQKQPITEYQEELYQQELPTSTRDIVSTSSTSTPTLVPLSCDPIMLTTSMPLLTPEECGLVSEFLEFMKNVAYDPDAEFHGDIEDIQKGAELLEKVRDTIDGLTGCPSHAEESDLPQYVVYEPKDGVDGKPTRQELLPYGLHVDTNNAEHLRHLTCLLYLNSNDMGATNFPLVRPFNGNISDQDTPDISYDLKRLRNGAKRLILTECQHTAAEEIKELDIAKDLEQAAVDLYSGTSQQSTGAGIRVLPAAGHVCIFSSLDDEGEPDPSSFHGGEALLDATDQKKILTFFKKIPQDEFRNKREFAKRVREKKKYLLERYF